MSPVISLLASLALLAAPAPHRPAAGGPQGSSAAPELVDLTSLVPDAVLDLRYATADNFLGRKLYPQARCLLLRPAAERLHRAAARLRRQGYRLLLWDCYRPPWAQWEMWRHRPRAGYLAHPRRGSHHSRGAAVDLSLVTLAGGPVEMPSPFDAFDRRARADATEGVSAAARRHRQLLRRALEAEGFLVNPAEWWHFATRDARSHPVIDVPLGRDGGLPPGRQAEDGQAEERRVPEAGR